MDRLGVESIELSLLINCKQRAEIFSTIFQLWAQPEQTRSAIIKYSKYVITHNFAKWVLKMFVGKRVNFYTQAVMEFLRTQDPKTKVISNC
jgi:hypothetical protein